MGYELLIGLNNLAQKIEILMGYGRPNCKVGFIVDMSLKFDHGDKDCELWLESEGTLSEDQKQSGPFGVYSLHLAGMLCPFQIQEGSSNAVE